MDKIYLQFNLVNWVTVVIMASLGLALVGFIGGALKKRGIGPNGGNNA